MEALDYESISAEVAEIIVATGRPIRLQRYSASADPAMPWLNAGTVVSEFVDVTGTFAEAWGNEFGISWVKQDLLDRVRQICMVPGSAIAKEYLKFTHIVDEGKEYAIEWGQVVQPGSLTLLYIFGIKE